MLIATIMILFNLQLTPLYNAIAAVESDNGVTSNNVYRLTETYIKDLDRLYPNMRFTYDDRVSRIQSELMMFCYWRHYAREMSIRYGKPINYELLARIHNGGPRGAFRPSADRYWAKVKSELDKQLR